MLTRYQLRELHLEVWKVQYGMQEAGYEVTTQDQFRLTNELTPTRAGSRFAGTVRAIAIENRHARFPFPEELFRGPFDQRWDWKGEWCGPVWVGETLDKLYGEGVPFHLL